MAALSEGEEGRKEKTKSLPPPPNRTAQRRWKNLTGRRKKPNEKIFSQEREESFLLLPLLFTCFLRLFSILMHHRCTI
jgi:hypothetical protein